MQENNQGITENSTLNKVLNIIVFILFLSVSYFVFTDHLDLGAVLVNQNKLEIQLNMVLENQKVLLEKLK